MSLVITPVRPIYQTIAEKALQLRQQGLTFRDIAKALQTDDKMVRKAIKWIDSRKSV